MKGILDIVTTVDGKETKKTWDATCEFTLDSVHIHYQDEAASVNVWLKDGRAEIVRKGDYGMQMAFEEGRTTKVILDIAGSVGEIQAKTHRFGYLLSPKSCMIHLQYSLCFSETEKQEMNLRMYAKCI